jgi:hypothetical protein
MRLKGCIRKWVERLAKGDVIFLYQSGVGIVALGEADGKLLKAPYHGKLENLDEEYAMRLLRFLTPSRLRWLFCVT